MKNHLSNSYKLILINFTLMTALTSYLLYFQINIKPLSSIEQENYLLTQKEISKKKLHIQDFYDTLEKDGLAYLQKSVETKSLPVKLSTSASEVEKYFKDKQYLRSQNNNITQIAEAINRIAKENKWQKITLLSTEMISASRLYYLNERYPKFKSYYSNKLNQISQLIKANILPVGTAADMNQHIQRIHSILAVMDNTYSALIQESTLIHQVKTDIQGQLNSDSSLDNSSTNVPHDFSNLILMTIAGLLVVTAGLIGEQMFRKIKENANSHKILLDQAGIAWGIFDLNGNLIEESILLNTFVSNFNTQGSNTNWDTISEILNLKNTYDLNILRDGVNQFHTKINKPNAISGEAVIKIIKDGALNQAMLIIQKDTPTFIVNNQKINTQAPKYDHKYIDVSNDPSLLQVEITSLVEESVEELSSFFQANNIILNITSETEPFMKCEPKLIKTAITQLLRDIGNYVITTGGPRKIDVILFNENERPLINFILYNSPITQMILYSQETAGNLSLDEVLSRFETELKRYSARITLENNFDEDTKFLFTNLSVQI